MGVWGTLGLFRPAGGWGHPPVSVLMVLISGILSLPLMIGVISHLLADLLFYPGIKLFYPFSNREFYFLRGRFKKYYNPWAFLSDSLRDKRTITFECILITLEFLQEPGEATVVTISVPGNEFEYKREVSNELTKSLWERFYRQ